MTNSTGIILAFDIGGTKLAVGIADAARFALTGRFERIEKRPTPKPGRPDDVLPVLFEIGHRLAEGRAIVRIGISIGGPLDPEGGIVLNFPHLPEWLDVPLAAIVAREFGARTVLDNDANLGALAEYRWGAGQGADPFVYVTMSTGIGGGVIIGGKLLHGVGAAAGEIGHVTVDRSGPICDCGNVGCLERMASGTNIARHARERASTDMERGQTLCDLAGGSIERITAEHVVQGVAAGDPLAIEIWEETVEYLAIGLGSVIHVLAPERVVIGGGVARAEGYLIEPLKEKLRNHVFYVPLDRIDVRTAALGHDSPLIGAATLALRDLSGEGS